MHMGCPWDAHRVPTGHPQAVYGLPVEYAHGPPTGYPWATHGPTPWASHGRSMNYPWNAPMGHPRPTRGRPTGYSWATHGLTVGDPRAATKTPGHADGMPTGCPLDAHSMPVGLTHDATNRIPVGYHWANQSATRGLPPGRNSTGYPRDAHEGNPRNAIKTYGTPTGCLMNIYTRYVLIIWEWPLLIVHRGLPGKGMGPMYNRRTVLIKKRGLS